MAEPFTFGIPLVARASARNWGLVEGLLELTLTSVLGQSDRDFQIVIAGHDRPRLPANISPVTFIEADWPAEPVRSDNRDSGRKKHAIHRHVLADGGGLLMFLDADDWVDRRLVETARATIGTRSVGGFIAAGFAVDLCRLRAAPIPHRKIFAGEFHRLCGSSTVLRLLRDDPDPLRCDPYRVLHEHYRWLEVARDYGLDVVRLPVCGGYVINTSENHSETYGPFAGWRRGFSQEVGREGIDIDQDFAARFGLSLDQLRAISRPL